MAEVPNSTLVEQIRRTASVMDSFNPTQAERMRGLASKLDGLDVVELAWAQYQSGNPVGFQQTKPLAQVALNLSLVGIAGFVAANGLVAAPIAGALVFFGAVAGGKLGNFGQGTVLETFFKELDLFGNISEYFFPSYIEGKPDGDDFMVGHPNGGQVYLQGGSDIFVAPSPDFDAEGFTVYGDKSSSNFGVSGGVPGNDYLFGGGGVDNLYGEGGDDVLAGGGSADYLDGGIGDDIFLIAAAADHPSGFFVTDEDIIGGSGNDTIRFTSTASGEVLTLSDNVVGIETVMISTNAGDRSGTESLSIDASLAQTTGIRMFGNDGANTLTAGAGADQLYGGWGTDKLYGGAGSDILAGGATSDEDAGGTFEDDGERDELYGAAGGDRYYLGTGDYAKDTGGGYFSKDAVDTYQLLDGVTRGLVTISDYDGAARVLLSSGTAVPLRAASADALSAIIAAASDPVELSDYIGRGDGSIALLETGNGDVSLAGGGKLSFTDFNWADSGLHLDVGRESLSRVGTSGNDELEGTRRADILIGGEGDDELEGKAGDDELSGEDGNDELEGGKGNDMLYGDRGDDTLEGDDGNDSLWGGTGNDRLAGGDGRDMFVFHFGDGADIITDFSGSRGRFYDNSARGRSADDDHSRYGDLIEISGDLTGFDAFADILAHASQVGDNAVIDFGGGDTLTLQHTRVTNLHADSFAFM
jgi:Ca2+-binding RTX toxin-like protein